MRPMEQQSPDPQLKLHHQPSSTQRRNPSLLRRTQWRQQSANPPPRVVSNTSSAELFTPTPAPRVDKGVDYEEEPISMRTRLQRHMMPRPLEIQSKPIVRRTRSQTQSQANIVTPARAAARRYPAAIFQYLALPVLDKETGKLLEYQQLRKDPRYAPIWNPSYANELGRLCQVVGKGTKGPRKQRVEGTDMFRVMHYKNIPKQKNIYICHKIVVCEYRLQKEYPNHTLITLAGGHIKYPRDLGTPTGSLYLVKTIINSVISRRNACFV